MVHWQVIIKRYTLAISCAVLAFWSQGEQTASAQPANFAIETVGDGDFAHFGEIALPNQNNLGDTSNIGIVVGADAVAVIDTGGSVQVGRNILAAVATISNKPVRYVINTHEHPDHVFGNAAFSSDVVFIAHNHWPVEMQKRSAFYIRALKENVGPASADARIVPPTHLVANEEFLDLGDRRLRLTAWNPAAHTDCDLTILDETTGVLFAGDLVFMQHVPVLDGSLKGWLSMLPRLAALPARIVVPGHGRAPGAWPDALAPQERYLRRLAGDTRGLIASGATLANAIPQIARSERAQWTLFDDYNPRNAAAAFAELEWE